MYAGVGEEPLIFLPGAIAPRRAPPVIQNDVAPPARKPPVIKERTAAPESTPKTLPTVVPMDAPPEEPSRLPLYIALGGVAVIGVGWLLFRK